GFLQHFTTQSIFRFLQRDVCGGAALHPTPVSMAQFLQRAVRQYTHLRIVVAEQTHQNRSLVAESLHQRTQFLALGRDWSNGGAGVFRRQNILNESRQSGGGKPDCFETAMANRRLSVVQSVMDRW